jgi:cell division protein FtsB
MSLSSVAPSKGGSYSGRSALSRAGILLALCAYAGIAAYCALSFFFGPAGLSSYRRLEERKAAMEANLVGLEAIGKSLGAELESLKTDPDRAAREARSLGYLRKGEDVIQFGERTERVRAISAGKVLPYAESPALSDLALKEIALGAGLALMAILVGPRPAPRRERRYR